MSFDVAIMTFNYRIHFGGTNQDEVLHKMKNAYLIGKSGQL